LSGWLLAAPDESLSVRQEPDMRLSADELYDILLIYREHLLPCWERYHAEGSQNFRRGSGAEIPDISKDTCRHTSAFLFRQLKSLGVEDLRACGGYMRHAEPLEGDALHENARRDPRDPARLEVDEDGFAWQGHFWIEHNGMVIDITKDQFGWAFDDIHDVETAAVIYRFDPDFQALKRFSALKSTVAKFEGQAQTFWQDSDPHFECVWASYEEATRRVSEVLGIRQPSPV
jgi:hypothetical protein